MPKHLPDVSGPIFTLRDTLDQERVRDLAKHHQIADDYDLCGKLEDAAFWYDLLTASNERRLPHSKHKDYLRELLKRAKDLEDALRSMNSELAWQLHQAWPHLASKDDWRSRMQEDARNLARAANRAVENLPSTKGGRPMDEAFKRLLDTLIDTYEESTGKKAGYQCEEPYYDYLDELDNDEGSVDDNEKRRYLGPFIDFATQALELFGIKKTNVALGKALERRLRQR
jgi:hypothetical protein